MMKAVKADANGCGRNSSRTTVLQPHIGQDVGGRVCRAMQVERKNGFRRTMMGSLGVETPQKRKKPSEWA